MKRNLKIDKQDWKAFISTLIATLAGVLIAIWLTNSGIEQKEKGDTIKLLNTARVILRETKGYTATLKNAILTLEKDTLNTGKALNLKKDNPLPYPDLMETIISNELVSKNISEFSHSALYNHLINLRKLAKYETADYYQKNLEHILLLIDLEIKYQKGEINIENLELKYTLGQKRIYGEEIKSNVIEILKTD